MVTVCGGGICLTHQQLSTEKKEEERISMMTTVKEFEAPIGDKTYHLVGGYVAFGCCDEEGYETGGNPDSAEIALRRAGFDVTRMSEASHARLEFPGDDFMLVTCPVEEASDQVVGWLMDEINAIVGPYGGDLSECGWVDPDLPPFEELFNRLRRYH
jgi:hypothetical protein